MHAALACTTKVEAEALVLEEMERIRILHPYRTEAEQRFIVKGNIGYCSGYYSREEAARLLDLFECEHPYFGKIEDWPKSPEAALLLGFKAGEAMKKRSEDALVSTGVENRTV